MASFRNEPADQIADRIKAVAQRVWDNRDIDDPLIQFLIEANASEIKGIYDHLDESEDRLLNRFASLLLPGQFTGPIPAHALAHARPDGTDFLFKPETALFVEKRQKRYYFSPATSFQVYDGFLGAVVINEQAFFPEKTIFNISLDRIDESNAISKISLGVLFRNVKPSVKDLSLFFRIDNVSHYEQGCFYNALSKCVCYLNGHKATQEVQIGLPYPAGPALQETLTQLKVTECKVLDGYARHYLTIKGELDFLQSEDTLPDAVSSYKDKMASLAKEEKTRMCWLDIHFPEPVKLSASNGKFTLAMNVFPVMNREYHESTALFNKGFPKLIPLKEATQGQYLLGVSKVFGFPESGKEQQDKMHVFHELPLFSLKLGAQGAGSYSIRTGGIGREEVYPMLERFSYIFSKYRQELQLREFIDVLSIEEFEQLLAKNYSDHSPTVAMPYLVLNPIRVDKDNYRVFVHYWTTQGTMGNQDFQNESLELEAPHSNIKPFSGGNALYLFSTPTGGQDSKAGLQAWTYLKDNLLRRGEIITASDVESFARTFLDEIPETRNGVIGIQTRKDYEIHPDPQYGLTRILSLILHFKEETEHALKKGICDLLEKRVKSQVCQVVTGQGAI